MSSTHLHSLPEDAKETLLEFPCSFAVKAMGRSESNFNQLVVELMRPYVPNLSEDAIKTRPSKAGNFTSVTVTFTAINKEQIDNVYYALTGHPDVLMAL